MSGIELANWNWKVVRRFVADWFGVRLCRSSSLNYLHRLGFAFKRPKKRLLKANEAKREAFVAEYAGPAGGGEAVRGQDILCRRGPLPCGCGIAGQVGSEGRTGVGELKQSAVWREGQLLLGGVLGDRGGGVDGTGG